MILTEFGVSDALSIPDNSYEALSGKERLMGLTITNPSLNCAVKVKTSCKNN